jgi:hypothetical protein
MDGMGSPNCLRKPMLRRASADSAEVIDHAVFLPKNARIPQDIGFSMLNNCQLQQGMATELNQELKIKLDLK